MRQLPSIRQRNPARADIFVYQPWVVALLDELRENDNYTPISYTLLRAMRLRLNMMERNQ